MSIAPASQVTDPDVEHAEGSAEEQLCYMLEPSSSVIPNGHCIVPWHNSQLWGKGHDVLPWQSLVHEQMSSMLIEFLIITCISKVTVVDMDTHMEHTEQRRSDWAPLALGPHRLVSRDLTCVLLCKAVGAFVFCE